MLVIAIIASSSMKLPKVNWPIDSENDRIRRTIAAKGMAIGTGSEQAVFIRRIWPRGERGRRGRGLHPGGSSIRGDPGVLDHLRPQPDVGLDDVGELSARRAVRLAAGGI